MSSLVKCGRTFRNPEQLSDAPVGKAVRRKRVKYTWLRPIYCYENYFKLKYIL